MSFRKEEVTSDDYESLNERQRFLADTFMRIYRLTEGPTDAISLLSEVTMTVFENTIENAGDLHNGEANEARQMLFVLFMSNVMEMQQTVVSRTMMRAILEGAKPTSSTTVLDKLVELALLAGEIGSLNDKDINEDLLKELLYLGKKLVRQKGKA